MSTDHVLETGDVLAARYRITRLIGAGATTRTYEAEDLTLRRPVAIKVLLAEVLANQEWRDYFRHETTAVAALHHPNLTRIYDWGDADGSTYVVTEFCAGGSLRDVLATRGRLSREQTAMLGLEVATALAYAHARGFVHGALRPSKIFFDADGRARVSDLGLAATLSSIARPAHDLEIARYASPEQVLGQNIDARSDVYSLSLILFECLTGEVPHAGASIESVRSNRLGAPLPHREELGPFDLLLALGAAPEASARPDAALFASRLESLAATLPVPRPVTVGPGNLLGFAVPSAHQVLTSPTGPAPVTLASGATPVVRPMDRPGYRENFETQNQRAANMRAPRRTTGSRAAILLVLIIVLLAALAGGVAWKSGVFTPSFTVPSVLNQTQSAALRTIAPDGFKLAIVGYASSSSVPSNEIVSQRPKPGTSLKKGSTISVRISSGPAAVPVPSVIGLSCAEATTQLASIGLHATCPVTLAVKSATVPRGNVVTLFFGTVANPTSVPPQSAVELALSTGTTSGTTTTSTTPATTTTTTTTTVPANGHAARAVPYVVGLNRAQTYAAMKSAELYYTIVPASLDNTWTKVFATSPAAGTLVPWHSNVVVSVK